MFDHEEFCEKATADIRSFFGLPNPVEDETQWGLFLPDRNAPCKGVRVAHSLANGDLHGVLMASQEDLTDAVRLCHRLVRELREMNERNSR